MSWGTMIEEVEKIKGRVEKLQRKALINRVRAEEQLKIYDHIKDRSDKKK